MHSHWKLWILCLIGLVLLSSSVKADDPEYQGEETDDDDADADGDEEIVEPEITSEAKTFVTKVGDTVILPCQGEHLKHYAIMWKKSGNLIVVGDMVVGAYEQGRLKINGTDLIVTDIKTSDTANYTCEISSKIPVQVTHHISVETQPRASFNGSSVVVKQGEPLKLSCYVEGYPSPNVAWERKGKTMLQGEKKNDGSTFTLTYPTTSRKHSGVYECVATNSLGDARTAVNVEITYVPEIEIEKDSVHSGRGNDVELKCTVHAEPKAQVTWYYDGQKVNSERHHSMHKMNHVYTLHIKNVMEQDYGNYSCVANNSYGRDNQNILLSEAPSQPVFIHDDKTVPELMSYKLVWTLDSTLPMVEYKLKYRKLQEDWKEMEVEGDKKQENVYIVSHILKGLSPSSDYEATLMARNSFGWSKDSRVHSFHINGDIQSLEAASEPGAKAAVGSNGAGCLVSSSQQTFALFLAIIVTNFLRWQ